MNKAGQTTRMDFQHEKQVVRDYYTALDSAPVEDIGSVLASAVAEDYLWRGFHPFDEMTDPIEIAACFWQPLRRALAPMQRRLDIFMAGQNTASGRGGESGEGGESGDGGESSTLGGGGESATPSDGGGIWVASMGHLMGLFDSPWLGIPPTGRLALLRYAEFHRVEGGRIVETAMYFDIPHLMMQAGLTPFPPQTGAHMVQPGPLTHGGVMFDPQPPAEAEMTRAAINRMANDLKSWSGGRTEPLEDELRRSWHEDMLWWGPAGIGSTYTIARYAAQHAAPFRAGFSERIFNGHICRIAEGHFGGFFGWPNLTLKPTGGFMGMPGSDRPGDMRVIDIYRREGDKLAENWVFIDLLHFWQMQGVDILGRMAQCARPESRP